MTYEEIKEELDKTYERQSWTQDEIDFNSVCKGYPMTGTSLFIAGFRAAERLAKIEELKKLDAEIVNMLDDDYTTMSCHLALRISELERGH